MSLQRDDCVPTAVVRLMGDGAVVGLDGEWSRLCPELRFGCSAFDVIPSGLRDGILSAIAEPHATRFRVAQTGREWLCRVERDGEGFILHVSELPASILGEEPSHHRMGRFMDAAPFHVSVADALDSGRIVVWNHHSETMFGYTCAEALGGLTARDLYASESDHLSMLSAVECGRSVTECSMMRKDGTTFVGRVLVMPGRDVAGVLIERCTFIEDLSGPLQAESDLIEAQRLAGHDDRVRLMGELAGGIAHDFNNVLTAIMSSAELLKLQCRELPGATEDLAVITNAARSGSSLTRRLLTFTRNKVEDPRRIDVPAWFSELLPFLQRLVPERVRFEHAMEGEGAIEIDPNELEQVVLNLVVNAVGAMPDGGALTLRCCCLDNRMLLEVEDTGVGIPAELHERVFEPFFTTRVEGTGLGLSTARAIVRRAAGEIWVLSATGKGSCFSVSVPLCASDSAPEPVPRPTSAPCEDRGFALLIEDQPDVRYAVERLLRSLGFDVRAEPDVRSGQHALGEMERCTLLLTDYMLPDGTGLDLIGDARAVFPEAHAVLMSGYLQELEVADKSFDRLIAKPFTRSQLVELLASLE
ncbi:MAG: response regulator [Nannocystaceae bacterium]|nr:response regulator [Nannocystaceae bacterium]